jgi:subfamily B ATP-binding cassette protein MsbA
MKFLSPFRGQPQLSRIAWRYGWSVPFVAGLGILNGLLEGIGIGLLIPLLATLLPHNSGDSSGGLLKFLDAYAAGYDWHSRVLIIAFTMLGIIIVKNIVQVASRVFVAWIDGRAGHDIRCALADRLHAAGYPFFLNEDPARLIHIVSAEAWHASDAIKAAFTRIAGLSAVVAFSVMLLIVEWRLTLIVGIGALLIRFVQQAFVVRLRRLSEAVAMANWLLTGRMLFAVNAARLIRLFGSESYEREQFARRSEDVRHTMFVSAQSNAALSPTLEVLHVGLFLIVMVIAAFTGVALPVLAAFLVLLNRLQPHLRILEAATGQLAAEAGQVREVEWLLDPADKPAPPAGALPFTGLDEGIEFRAVSFDYGSRPGSPPALADVSLSILKGRSTALIGASGSGKSTVINLLCRLVEPTSGAILVDGRPLSQIDPRAWIGGIAIAGQDVDIIEGSIAENIAYGRSDLSHAEIAEAARLADAHGFIAALPEGYESMVGSRGLNLSGGQRQRIAIARALARQPQILILDEATNAVDGLSEAAIMRLLREVHDMVTTIVVSHRASTLALCDDGVVIAHGRVVEAGPLGSLDAWRRMSVAG